MTEVKDSLKIRKLEKQIDDWQARGDEDWSSKLTRLREYVLFCHTDIETNLEWLISTGLHDFKGASRSTEEDLDKFSLFVGKTVNIFEGMTFFKKADLAFKLSAISQPLYSQIVKVNKIRNDFAHPRNRGYKKYRNQKEYSEALKSLVEATQQLSDLVIATDETGFKTQD